MSEQGALLKSETSRSVFDRVQDDSSSLFCLRDSFSFQSSLTASTERSSLLSRRFDFDHEILRSKVYHGQIRSWMRRGLRRDRSPNEPSKRNEARSIASLIEKQIKTQRVSDTRTFKLLLIEPSDGENSIGLENLSFTILEISVTTCAYHTKLMSYLSFTMQFVPYCKK